MTNDRLDVVFVFLDSGDKNLYQLRYWVQTLQRLAAQRDVTVLHASEEAASLLKSTSLQAVRVDLPEGLVAFLNEKRPRLLLYPNQNVRNFYALRYGQGLHAWVSHGESEKAYMFQNTLKRYDLYFAAGQAAADRVARRIVGYNPNRIRMVGHPQSADKHQVPDWYHPSAIAKSKVFYAPTWEGVSNATRYSSIASHGVTLVRELMASGHQVIYRPHPLSGTRDREVHLADRQIRALIGQANRGQLEIKHQIDTGNFGWQLSELDMLITDVSAVAYDWLATRKPLVVTTPVDPGAVQIESPLFGSIQRLEVSQIKGFVDTLARHHPAEPDSTGQVLAPVAPPEKISEYYFHSSRNADSALLEAVDEALEMSATLADSAPMSLFLSRGKKLGWLRYPNFLLRTLSSLLGLWTTASKRLETLPSDSLYTHFSDPFDADSVSAWVPRLKELAESGRVVFATNQITTKLLLNRALGKLASNVEIIPCVSTRDAEVVLSALNPSTVFYLKDHPTNLAMLRANGIRHVLLEPERDKYFVATHSLVMYDSVVSESPEVVEIVKKIHKISQPKLD